MSRMNQPLGEIVFDILIAVLILTWGIGWIVLLATMSIQKMFPSLEPRAEGFLQNSGRLIGRIQQVMLVTAAILLLIKLLASWLGWAPSLMGE